MKRVLFVVLALIFVCTAVQAQDMMFGAKAGLTLGTIDKDVEDLGMPSEVDKKFRMGMTFGAMMHMPMGENMVFMGEAAYIQKGVKFDFAGEEVIMKVDFLQIDALVKYMFADAFGIYAGPALGFLLSAEEEYDGETADMKDYMKSTEFSLSFGGQFMFAENMMADARYNMGLTALDDDEEEDMDIKSRTIILSVGYMF